MSDMFPVAGCKIFIAGPLASKKTDFIESDFAAESWIEIDGWDAMGAIGDTAALMTKSLINRGRDIKQKGTANAGSMQCKFGQIVDDAGQIALIAASQPTDKNNYAFKIELNDTPASGPSPAPSKRYFIALVMSAVEQGGEANTFRDLMTTLEVNSNIVRVAATTGA